MLISPGSPRVGILRCRSEAEAEAPETPRSMEPCDGTPLSCRVKEPLEADALSPSSEVLHGGRALWGRHGTGLNAWGNRWEKDGKGTLECPVNIGK